MARARKARRIPEWMIGVAITLVVLVMGFMRPSFLETFEYQLFDLRLKWFGAHTAPQNIAIVAIDDRHGPGIDDQLGAGRRAHHALANPGEVPIEPKDPVRLVPPQIGLHQGVGKQRRISLGNACRRVHGRGETGQTVGVDPTCTAHVVHCVVADWPERIPASTIAIRPSRSA